MINIQDIVPFMKKGWVAMDEDGRWFWHENKPFIEKLKCAWFNYSGTCRMVNLGAFDIAPADDWTKSLIKVGGK